MHSTGSQWYMPTVTSPAVSERDLSVIGGMMSMPGTPTPAVSSSNVVELKEELVTQRPLRSEVEKERRLSKTTTVMRGVGGDTVSMSDDSNRNSISEWHTIRINLVFEALSDYSFLLHQLPQTRRHPKRSRHRCQQRLAGTQQTTVNCPLNRSMFGTRAV